MSRTRIHNFFVSLDGFGAGDYVTHDAPIGDGAKLFERFDGRHIHGIDKTPAPLTLDRALTSTWAPGIGAEIMGRRKFGPQSGPWLQEDDWRGWWGDEPPFHTPVFVLTHHPRPPIEFANGTTFHFIDASPPEALQMARDAAGGLDVRIGGGPSSIRDFLAAGLVDFMHVVIVPVVLGRGVSPWGGLEALEESFDIESVSSPSTGVTHLFFNSKVPTATSGRSAATPSTRRT